MCDKHKDTELDFDKDLSVESPSPEDLIKTALGLPPGTFKDMENALEHDSERDGAKSG